MADKILFAPLVRVSTEKQRDKGESLRTQKAQIIEWVKNLNGVIPEDNWKYSGQESASMLTPSYERKLLKRLLDDSSKGTFNAVIVCDASRWSRNNHRSRDSLEILKEHKIRFFIGSKEVNFKDPVEMCMLGVQTEFNEMFVKVQSGKSHLSCEARFKRGIPAVAQVPYGRTFNRALLKAGADPSACWGIDEEKKAKIEKSAKLFLEGENRPAIIEALGLTMNPSGLYKVFKNQCGDTWTTKYGTMKIPRLLPDKTIEAVLKRTASNKTITHSPRGQHFYLLSGLVFCDDCGISLNGVSRATSRAHPENIKYKYRHPKNSSIRRECPNYHAWDFPAEDIEEAVMTHVYSMYGDKAAIEKAMLAAIPDADKKEELRNEVARLEAELKKVKDKKYKIIDRNLDGFLDDEEANFKKRECEDREAKIKEKISHNMIQLQNAPTNAQLDQYAKLRATMRTYLAKQKSYVGYKSMSDEKKRRILVSLFNGVDAEGRKLGIYIKTEKPDGGKRTFTYTIKGMFTSPITGLLPIPECEKEEMLQIPDARDLIDTDCDVRTFHNQRNHTARRLRLRQR